MSITKPEMLQTLKDLVEAKLKAEDWVAWWTANGKAAEKMVGAKSAARLKPKFEHSPAEGAFNSQGEAWGILKKAGISVKRSNAYFDRYCKDENKREKEQANQLKPRIDLLKKKFPKLHACLYRNSKKIEKFEPGASEEELAKAEKSLKAKLPKPVREFFKVTKHWSVEGFELDLDMVFEHPGDKSAPDGKRYLCLANYFRDADGDQVLVDISKPTADPEIFYYAHSAESPKVQRLAKNWTDFLEKLPKQYLNQMFYYS